MKLSPIDSNDINTINAQKRSKDISTCDIKCSTVILRSYKNTFHVQRKQ